MFWHSHGHGNSRFAGCRGRWEKLICLWKDLISSFHYGNLTKSFSVALRSVRHLFCQALSDLPCLFVCVYACSECEAGSTACVDVCFCACSFTLSAELQYFPCANFCFTRFICFLEIPPRWKSVTVMTDWETASADTSLFTSSTSLASPLPSPHFFSLAHTFSLFLPRSPDC